MHAPGPLNYAAGLIAVAGCAVTTVTALAQEPASLEERSPYDKAKIRADFARRRFRVQKRAWIGVGTILTLAGIALTGMLGFLDNRFVVAGMVIVEAFLARWTIIGAFCLTDVLRELRDREVWELFYMGGKWPRSWLGSATEIFLLALEKFAEQHPREHARLAPTLRAEYDAAQRTQEQAIADSVAGLKRMLV